jgi:integration host factor subunit beta
VTKSQLIEHVIERAPHVPPREVERIVNAMFETMVESLRREERIEIRGFGSFSVTDRPGREARNPKTGKRVVLGRRLSARFTVGKELRERINRDLSGGEAPPAEERRLAVG